MFPADGTRRVFRWARCTDIIVDANVEVASSDDVGLVLVSDGFGRGLETQLCFFLSGKEVPPQSSLASREER